MEHLTEVVSSLENADKFVRLGDLNRALDEIVRVREKNPAIMYARAYEEYIRSIVLKQTELAENISDADSKETVIGRMLPILEKILDLAVKEVKRSAIHAGKQKDAAALKQQQEEELRNEERARSIGLTKKISDYLDRAKVFVTKRDFHNALNEVARAFVLNPTDERIVQAEEEIKALQERYEREIDAENKRKQIEESKRRERLTEERRVLRQQEKELEERKKEEAFKQARSQKIKEYLQIARGLFAEGKPDEALGQLAFLMVLDPLNEEVLDLNWKIRDAESKMTEEKIVLTKQRRQEEKKKAETIRKAIEKNLAKAEELLASEKFSDALRVVTQAYYIDPTNEKVIACEKRIMAAEEEVLRREEEQRRRSDEERRRKQEAELHRLSIEQQKRVQTRQRIDVESKLLRDEEEALLFLSKARGYYNQGDLDKALEQIAKAFKMDPFDDEISKLQHEILDAQKKAKRSRTLGVQPFPGPENQGDEQTVKLIDQHIVNVKQLRSTSRYREALDEIAQAYRLDPANEVLFALEAEIQQELLKYEHEQQVQQEGTKKDQGIKKSLALARDALSREAHAEASAWVDYAMSFDMQRIETIQLKEEIERSQRSREEQKASEDKEVIIQIHLSKAMEFLVENRPFEAIFEVDLALRLDPTHKEALALRIQLNEYES